MRQCTCFVVSAPRRAVALLHVSARRTLCTSAVLQAKYPPKRGNYKTLTAADVDAFAGMLSDPSKSMLSALDGANSSTAKVTEDELSIYNQDWM